MTAQVSRPCASSAVLVAVGRGPGTPWCASALHCLTNRVMNVFSCSSFSWMCTRLRAPLRAGGELGVWHCWLLPRRRR
uniref:Putative secreted protein n=1 Tax=Ixodes ricinus TaxID=34613 RepID=A0A6B0U3L7_IXORI